jgi:hypothetical protein
MAAGGAGQDAMKPEFLKKALKYPRLCTVGTEFVVTTDKHDPTSCEIISALLQDEMPNAYEFVVRKTIVVPPGTATNQAYDIASPMLPEKVVSHHTHRRFSGMHLNLGLRQLAPLLGVIGMCAVGSVAHAELFTNSTPITIGDDSVADPYPSTITVSGITSPIAKISVTLNGFSHTFPDDVGVMLVGPTGAGQIVFRGATDIEVVDLDLTFEDGGADWPDLGETLESGTYQPFSWWTNSVFPAPAPTIAGVNPTTNGEKSFGVFNGTDANGTWSLYVADFAEGDEGSISGGWSLNISPVPGPSSVAVLAMGLAGLPALRFARRRKKS